MPIAQIIPGRLIGPRTVELDEPASANGDARVEVIVRTRGLNPAAPGSALSLLQSLQAGQRTREDIDNQISSERESCD
jgi:hypothetical protein